MLQQRLHRHVRQQSQQKLYDSRVVRFLDTEQKLYGVAAWRDYVLPRLLRVDLVCQSVVLCGTDTAIRADFSLLLQ